MGLRFVLGRTGTGKTRRVLDEVTRHLVEDPEGPALILLVPEQATFQTEQALVRRPEIEGYARAEVLSFRRLAWRVLRATGTIGLPTLSDRARRMVLRALLSRHREELGLFGEIADRPGVVDGIARTLSEFQAHRRTPADLLGAAEAAELAGRMPLALKLRDLALLARSFEEHVRDRFLDPDRYLGLLAEAIAGTPWLRGSEIWVDGFSGFTPQELEVLSGLLDVAERVSVTLLMDCARGADPRQLDEPTGIFRPSIETHLALVRAAGSKGIPLEDPVNLDRAGEAPHRFRGAPELAHLERHVLGVPRPAVFEGPVERIRIEAFPSIREEVDAVAREILRLARDEGLRFREMAVVLRDQDAYADRMEAALATREIPYFLDRRRPVPHHPLVELARAAFEIVAEGWLAESVFRALKTDLVPVPRQEVDRLESYVLEHGLAGPGCWDGPPWTHRSRRGLDDEDVSPSDEKELAEIDGIRKRCTTALLAFHRRVTTLRAPTHRDLAEALFALFEELAVRERIEEWMEQHRVAGRVDEARAEEQVWRDLLGLLDDGVEALGDQGTTVEEFGRVLEAGLASLELGLIPPGLDQVVVGTIERSRHLGIRAVFVPGAVEGALPPVPTEDPMLTDGDRDLLREEQLPVGPTSREQLFHEHYFGYLTLTRASGWLWLSLPGADEQGRDLAPAPVLRRLRQAFPALDREAAPPSSALEDVESPGDLVAKVASELREARESERPVSTEILDAHGALRMDPELAALARPVLAAVDYAGDLSRRTAALPPELAAALYRADPVLRTSVSRLESAAWCPFQHFARYGLGLADRPSPELAPSVLGELKHASLERFVARLEGEKRSWSELDDAEARSWLDAIVDELEPRLASDVRLSNPLERERVDRVREALGESASLLGLHARRSDFEPVGAEIAFGDGPGALPSLEFPVTGDRRVALRGRIDRLDAFTGPDGRFYLRVIDYKSSRGGAAFAIGEVALGLQLQLVTYLLAAVRGAPSRFPGERIEAAGALYFPVHDPVASLELRPEDGAARSERLKAYRTTGLIRSDAVVLDAMDRELDAAGASILPASRKKNGELAAHSSVASGERMEALFAHTERRASALAAQVLDGDVSVHPVRLGPSRTACRFCTMRPVCQFDPLLEGQQYRAESSPKGEAAWARIEGAAEGEGPGGGDP